MALRRFATGQGLTSKDWGKIIQHDLENAQRVKQQMLIYGAASLVAFLVVVVIIRWLWLRRAQIGASLIYAAGRVYRVKNAASQKASTLADKIKESAKK
jgi:ribose/xylose/arabinose/galactoside ABC-type transport system permease subunit